MNKNFKVMFVSAEILLSTLIPEALSPLPDDGYEEEVRIEFQEIMPVIETGRYSIDDIHPSSPSHCK